MVIYVALLGSSLCNMGTYLDAVDIMVCFRIRKKVSNTAESVSDCILLLSVTSGAKEAAL